MAQGISRGAAARYRFPHLAHVHFRVRSAPARARWRRVWRGLLPSPWRATTSGVPVVTPALEASGEPFQSGRWGFVEEFWDPAFHRLLSEQWPPDRFLDPAEYVTKSYDIGMRYAAGAGNDPEYLADFPAYRAAYAFLRSDEFCQRLSDLVGDGVLRTCYQIHLTRSCWGSSVIPHQDSQSTPGRLNLLLFIDGSGGPRSGGLAFWKDGDFREKIFEPMNLRNTCAYYDMSEDFYHGFEPVRFGAFRRTINATYRAAAP